MMNARLNQTEMIIIIWADVHLSLIGYILLPGKRKKLTRGNDWLYHFAFLCDDAQTPTILLL
jgi:hypothetical protein